MPHYKLTYFNLRGVGEIIRQIFAVAGQYFEDVRVEREEWPGDIKEKMPFGQMPVLEEDGRQLPQSYAIARYLARKYDLAGGDALEQALVDSLADQFKDFKHEIHPYFVVLVKFAPGDLNALEREVLRPACEKFFKFINAFLKKSKSGFLVGSSLSWVDLLLAEGVASLAAATPHLLDHQRHLIEHMDKIHSIGSVKRWRETRPVTPF